MLKRFADIPKMIRGGSYRTHVDWKYLEDTLFNWIDKRSNGDLACLDIDPYFQRPLVWTEAQQIAYVEYILKGGVSGRELYFNCVGWQGNYKGPFYLVDGKQRLHTARQFLNNKIPAFGTYFKDYEDRITTDAFFCFNVNDLKTEKEVLQWYLEMNTGGTPHTQDEIDKVVNLLKKV